MKRVFVILALAISLSSCSVVRSLRWWQPDLADSSRFRYARITSSPSAFRFVPALGQQRHHNTKTYLDSVLNDTETNAFLIIKNDSLIYQYYGAEKNASSLHASFSIAKSYVATLVGIAIDKGIIKSTQDLVIKYLPELKENDERFNRLTIQHVLDMRSSVDFDENKETPFAGIAKLYYGASVNHQVSKLKMKAEPGKAFEYQSINTQLLVSILERASGEKAEALLAKYLWHPLGTESDAIWSVDDRKTVKGFCCLNATATDFARLGRLYLKNGEWEGKQIISKKWVEDTVNPDTLLKKGYKNQWWASRNVDYFRDSLSAMQSLQKLKLDLPIRKLSNGNYYYQRKSSEYRAEGILGQIVYVHPERQLIIVRLGAYPKKNIYFNGFIPQIAREL
ncbi:MAG: class C beta-lactamase-related serine hydrolase [Pedobacter sp.]|nr:MAG: class C beta-lactamase-related serine hydrolase [Pedobacter sp.]